jgi:putative oxidoreductase
MLLAFERAESEEDPALREALLTFVIVGGGPTGVELAGAVADFARTGLDKEYRIIDPASARVLLVQSAARVLPVFSAAQSARARRSRRSTKTALPSMASVLQPGRCSGRPARRLRLLRIG